MSGSPDSFVNKNSRRRAKPRVPGLDPSNLIEKIESLLSDKVAKTIESAKVSFLEDPEVGKIIGELSTDKRDLIINKLECSLTLALQEAIKDLSTELSASANKIIEDIDSLRQERRNMNLCIIGIPESKGEDLSAKTRSFIEHNLNINIPDFALARLKRVGKTVDNLPNPTSPNSSLNSSTPSPRPRPIIISLNSYAVRSEILKSRKLLKGKGTVIVEDLTPSRRKLYLRAVELFGRNNVWTIAGIIKWSKDGKTFSASTSSQLDSFA